MATATPTGGAYKPKAGWIHRHFDLLNEVTGILGAAAFLGVVILIFLGPRGLDMAYVQLRFWSIFSAMVVNLTLTTLSYVIGMVIGFFVGWIRVNAASSKRPAGAAVALWAVKQFFARLAYGYVEIMRGTPILVQMFFVWAVVTTRFGAAIGATMSAYYAGIIALTMNTGAYQGEIFRGGLQAIHHGQIEAARALGLSYWGTMQHIILPQALRLIIPPLTNEYIGLLKASAALYTLGLKDTTYWGVYYTQRSLKVFEVFAIVTASFLLFTVPLAFVAKFIERHYRVPGLGIQEEKTTGPRTGRGLGAKVAALPILSDMKGGLFTQADMQRMFTGVRRRKLRPDESRGLSKGRSGTPGAEVTPPENA